MLRFLEELSYDEIGQIIDCPIAPFAHEFTTLKPLCGSYWKSITTNDKQIAMRSNHHVG